MTVVSRSPTPISPGQQRALERRILRALAAGDAKAATRLQAVYRGSRVERTLLSPEPPRLVTGGQRSGGRSVGVAPPVGPAAHGQVAFSALAMDTIRDHREAGYEQGCTLVGVRDGRGNISVEACGYWRTDFWAKVVTLGLEDLLRDAAHFRPVGWGIVGDVHTHSWRDGGVSCSEFDRRAWSGCATRYGKRWAGVILSPGGAEDERWIYPKLTAWLVDPGSDVVRPAACKYTFWED